MAFKLKLHKLATQEWLNVVERYNAIKVNLGIEVFKEIELLLNYVKKNPFHFQKRENDIRIAFTKRFHFGIYYKVIQETIVVLAILHAKEDKKKMTKRKHQ